MPRVQSHQFFALSIFALVVGAYLAMAMYFPVAYIWATYEDLYGEWAQTWFFAAACGLAVWTARYPSPG